VVDLARELDEARLQTILARLPCQVERIDRDAVPSEARARLVRHEAEWLGRRRTDYLENVDTHAVGDDLQLVHQADVHGAVNVLQELRHLGGTGGAHRNDLVHRLAVQRHADPQAGGRRAAADLGNVARRELRVAGILPFRRKAQKDVPAHLEAALLDAWLELFLGRAGVGRAFQRDELSGSQMRQERLEAAGDETEIGFPRRGERRRYADDQRVGFGYATYVRRGLKAPAAGGGDGGIGNMQEVAFPGSDRRRLGGVDVEADNGEPRLGEA